MPNTMSPLKPTPSPRPKSRTYLQIKHTPPPIVTTDSTSRCSSRSSLEPTPSELSDEDWIEVPDKEWSDKELMDDARPGRCVGKGW